MVMFHCYVSSPEGSLQSKFVLGVRQFCCILGRPMCSNIVQVQLCSRTIAILGNQNMPAPLNVDELLRSNLLRTSAHQWRDKWHPMASRVWHSSSEVVWGSILDIDWRWAVPTVSRVPSEISPAFWDKDGEFKHKTLAALLFKNMPEGHYTDVKAIDLIESDRCVAYPIGSMYGIYANIEGILMVNVTIYIIHGSYGYCSIV